MSDAIDDIGIEAGQALATLRLLVAGIDSGTVKLTEVGMIPGTASTALRSVEYGLQRIQGLADR